MKTIEISEETYEKIKDQLIGKESVDLKELDDLIGNNFFFRTVTYHFIGKVVGRLGDILMLKNASWVADSGRFTDCIKSGILNEVEPLGNWNINLSTVTDFGDWKHKLPTEQL